MPLIIGITVTKKIFFSPSFRLKSMTLKSLCYCNCVHEMKNVYSTLLEAYLFIYNTITGCRNENNTNNNHNHSNNKNNNNKAQESVARVVSGCSAIAQTLYLTRHNPALKILFFEMLKGYQPVDAIPPWYSPAQPKPVYQDDKVMAY